jgi:hypothetical protein
VKAAVTARLKLSDADADKKLNRFRDGLVDELSLREDIWRLDNAHSNDLPQSSVPQVPVRAG